MNTTGGGEDDRQVEAPTEDDRQVDAHTDDATMEASWVGPYRIESVIGRGSTGIVYRARASVGVERIVAVKRLPMLADDSARRRFLDEAQALTKLDHPNIVRLLDIVEDNASVALVMQYAPNGSLSELLHRSGPQSPVRVVELLAPIAYALASAHRRGIVHGDVKPSNILLTADDVALLADFDVVSSTSPRSASRTALGSAAYLDPCLLDGEESGPLSDIYSLGVCAYELLTGRLPFDGPTALAVLRSADRGEFEHLDRSTFGEIGPAVERAMGRRCEDRQCTHPRAA